MLRGDDLVAPLSGISQFNDIHQVELDFQQILQVDPNNPNVYFILGAIAHREARHDAAIDSLGKAIAPGSGQSRLSLRPRVSLNGAGEARYRREPHFGRRCASAPTTSEPTTAWVTYSVYRAGPMNLPIASDEFLRSSPAMPPRLRVWRARYCHRAALTKWQLLAIGPSSTGTRTPRRSKTWA